MDVLLVDDDHEVSRAYSRVARAVDHRVELAMDGEEALRLLASRSFDLVVLDVTMPGMSGLEVCRAMRSRGDLTPVLILTAHAGDDAEVEALTAGADDFVAKPCAPHVFQARLMALARRHQRGTARSVVLGRATFDAVKQAIAVIDGGRERIISLSQMESRVLSLLASSPNRAVSRDRLLETCWDRDAKVSDNALAAVAARLRHRLEGSGLSIRAARGRGLVLVVGSSDRSSRAEGA
jgi:DNA-binding response OmpR family regulator